MLIGCPSTKDQMTGKKGEEDDENKLSPIFHQKLMDDFRFMEAARLQSGEYEGIMIDSADIRDNDRLRHHMTLNRDGLVRFPFYREENEDVERHKGLDDNRIHRFMTQMSIWPPLDIWAHWVLDSRAFSITMLTIIILSSILMSIEGENLGFLDDQQNDIIYLIIESVDFFFLLMFAAEIILKWMDNFWDFWKENWNIFDFTITILLFFPPLLDIIVPNNEDESFEAILNILRYFRIARILRTLNAVTRIRKIWLIWHAITRTFTALIFITILMAIFFYIFAIIGIQIFGPYSKTHIPQRELKFSDRFTSLPWALLTLFQVFTLDQWYSILKDIVAVQGFLIPGIYFLTWLLLGSIIFNNFFAGVMVNYFQNISEELQEEAIAISRTTQLAKELEWFSQDDSTEVNEDAGEDESLLNWETRVLQNMDILQIGQNIALSPTIWSRDTLFHYYIILEAQSSNIHERDQLMFILNQALLAAYSS